MAKVFIFELREIIFGLLLRAGTLFTLYDDYNTIRNVGIHI